MRTGFWGTPSLLVQIVFGLLTAGLGFFSFVYTLVCFQDFNAGTWSFVCGVISLAVVHLHVLFLKHSIDEWYDPEAFESLKMLGLLVSSLALVFFGYYLSYGITKGEELKLAKNAHYYQSIVAFLSLAWGANLFFSCQKYKRFVELCEPRLVGNRYFRL